MSSAVVEGLRPTALSARDALGRATSARRALPALLITGTQRGGTTSLYKALVQQPHVFRPVWRKGVHYFDVAYDRGPQWYRSHFPLERTLARAAARHRTRSFAFESSPYYLFHPLAPQRIAATVPDARVVVLVRDPVERAASAHAHELARGYETLPFAEALAAEEDRLAGERERLLADPTYDSHAYRHQAYRARGQYADQLEHLAAAVGREQVKVIDSHRFFTDPEPVFADLLHWLGSEVRGRTVFERHNARPRTAPVDAVTRELDAHFESHDARLEEWLGAVPSWRG